METIEKIGSQELVAHLLNSREGFEYLGSGSYRTAYKGPDGLVYKKNQYRARAEYGYNQHENDVFTTLRNHGYLWVPTFTLHQVGDDDVMVVQYLRDLTYEERRLEESENKKRYREIRDSVSDSPYNNVGIDPDSGLIYLRDGGGTLLDLT